MMGVLLEIIHPEVARRSCQTCQAWLFTASGARQLHPVSRQPMRRPAGVSTPCRTKDGCPKGTPEAKRSLTPQNQKAYQFHKQCEAVGQFPDDSLVRRHAGIIRQAEEHAQRMKQEEMISLLELLVKKPTL